MGVKNNFGAIDRRIRILVGFGLAAGGLATLGGLFELGTTVGAALTLSGLVLVGTGLVRGCLPHCLLGLDTSSTRKAR